MIKYIFVAFAITTLMASCGSALKNLKQEPLNHNVSNMPEKQAKLDKDQLKNWPHMGMISDTVPGISTKKAYDEIIKDHKGETVIVGVLDSGVDVYHEDLADVIWKNEKEIPGNGIDDDENGYVDDVYGWNFLGDAVYDNLEFTRILKKLKPKYEGKSKEDISADDLKQYELYLRAKKEHAKKTKEAKGIVSQIEFSQGQFEQNKSAIFSSIEMIEKEIDLEEITLSDIENLETDDREIKQAQTRVGMIMAQAEAETTADLIAEFNEAEEQMKRGKAYYEDQLKYYLNLDYDGREIVGDDVDDITDTDYGNSDVTGPTEDKEDILHGTHVAGIIAATRNNDIGMDGVASNVKLMSLRAVPDGDEYDKDIALGIRYAVDNGAKIINMSFGKYFSTHPEWVIDAMKYAADHDVLLVKAAGNDSKDLDKNRVYPNDQWPGQEEEITDNVIVVGALNPTYGEKMVAPFSNYGKTSVDVFAPGARIWATGPMDSYKFLDGTSMAAPQVAGVAALIRSYFPKLTAAQVKKVIMDSGITSDQEVILGEKQDIRKPFSEISKSGRMVNLYNALIMASKM
ncbi:MAG TPA: S8 family peptidase [Flavobacteriaceae bacterium]|nr:S8 family peptidase [Flavobacteriaceae bacterium]